MVFNVFSLVGKTQVAQIDAETRQRARDRYLKFAEICNLPHNVITFPCTNTANENENAIAINDIARIALKTKTKKTIARKPSKNDAKYAGNTSREFNTYCDARKNIVFTSADENAKIDAKTQKNDVHADIYDMLSDARLSIIRAISDGKNEYAQYICALRAIDNFMYADKKNNVTNELLMDIFVNGKQKTINVWQSVAILAEKIESFLSPRECDILELCLIGKTNSEIAFALGLNDKTHFVAKCKKIIAQKIVKNFPGGIDAIRDAANKNPRPGSDAQKIHTKSDMDAVYTENIINRG